MALYPYARTTHNKPQPTAGLVIERSVLEEAGNFNAATSTQLGRIFSQIHDDEIKTLVVKDVVGNDSTFRNIRATFEHDGDPSKIAQVNIMHKDGVIVVTGRDKDGAEKWVAMKENDDAIKADKLPAARADVIIAAATWLSEEITRAVSAPPTAAPAAAAKATHG